MLFIKERCPCVHSYHAQVLTHLLLHVQLAADGVCPSASASEEFWKAANLHA